MSAETISEPINPYGGDPRSIDEKIEEVEMQMSVLLQALPPLFGRGNRLLAASPYHQCIFRRLAAELRMYKAHARGDRINQLNAMADVVRESHVAIEFAMNGGEFYEGLEP